MSQRGATKAQLGWRARRWNVPALDRVARLSVMLDGTLKLKALRVAADYATQMVKAMEKAGL